MVARPPLSQDAVTGRPVVAWRWGAFGRPQDQRPCPGQRAMGDPGRAAATAEWCPPSPLLRASFWPISCGLWC